MVERAGTSGLERDRLRDTMIAVWRSWSSQRSDELSKVTHAIMIKSPFKPRTCLRCWPSLRAISFQNQKGPGLVCVTPHGTTREDHRREIQRCRYQLNTWKIYLRKIKAIQLWVGLPWKMLNASVHISCRFSDSAVMSERSQTSLCIRITRENFLKHRLPCSISGNADVNLRWWDLSIYSSLKLPGNASAAGPGHPLRSRQTHNVYDFLKSIL